MAKGQIQVIFGPMFSGKSTELLRRIQKYQISGQICIVIKYKKDNRCTGDYVATHDRKFFVALPCNEHLLDSIEKIESHDVIGIDEGQFFVDIVDFCELMANNGKIVIVAALDGTYQRKPFGSVLHLVPLSEHVVKLSAICMSCKKRASFSLRLTDETKEELIGGAEKYAAVCRSCHRKNIRPKN